MMKKYIKYLAGLMVAVVAIHSVAGTGSISDAVSGTRILASDFNKITGALEVDLVPRNSSGVATEEAGSLGTSTYPWSAVFIGQSSQGLSITDSTESMLFKTQGTTRVTINSTGLALTSFADGLITSSKLNASARFYERITTYTSGSGNFTVPANVTQIMVEMCGGGGGGGGQNVLAEGGAAGGGSGQYCRIELTVTPGSTYAYAVGAGGTGGNGAAGANGSNTTFNSWTAYAGRGGPRGTAGPQVGGVAVALSAYVPCSASTVGGDGGSGAGGLGVAGGDNARYSGGARGGGTTTGASGGGGGAGMGGNGGAGGDESNNGSSASANSCAGGGGAGSGVATSGGNGGSGFIRVHYISSTAD